MIIKSVLGLLFLIIAKGIQISPFSPTLFTPDNMYRSTFSATLIGTSTTFTINYPASPWTANPYVLYSLTSLSFVNHLTFQFNITYTDLVALTAQLSFDSTLKSVSFSFLIMDSSLYSATLSFFNYVMPVGTTTPQDFVVTNLDHHDAAFIVGIKLTQGPYPSGFAPSVDSQVVLSSTNIIKTNMTVSYNPLQIAVQKMTLLFTDFNLNAFKALNYSGSGQQFAIYGTSGYANDPYMTGTYINSYSKNYFFGIMALYDAQFLSGKISIDAINSLSTNAQYYNSQLLFATYHCPSSFPITDTTRQYCYSDCDIGFYYDTQYMCRPCNPNCYTCSMTATNCTSCTSPWILTYGFVCGCGDDHYQMTSLNGTITCNLCSSAISGCYSCSSATNCTSCMNNLQRLTSLLCVCPLLTTRVTLNAQVYCVDSIYSFPESCQTGFIQNSQTCLCGNFYNKTLSGGVCS